MKKIKEFYNKHYDLVHAILAFIVLAACLTLFFRDLL
jgi:hypothetical protein